MTKELEKQELALLKELELTQVNEFKMVDQIQKLSSVHDEKY